METLGGKKKRSSLPPLGFKEGFWQGKNPPPPKPSPQKKKKGAETNQVPPRPLHKNEISPEGNFSGNLLTHTPHQKKGGKDRYCEKKKKGRHPKKK